MVGAGFGRTGTHTLKVVLDGYVAAGPIPATNTIEECDARRPPPPEN